MEKQHPPDLRERKVLQLHNPAEDMAEDPLLKDSDGQESHQGVSTVFQNRGDDWKIHPTHPAQDMAEDPSLKDTFSATRKAELQRCANRAPVAPTIHPPDPPGIMGVNGWMPLRELEETSIFQKKIMEWVVHKHSYFPIVPSSLDFISRNELMVSLMAIWFLLTDYG